LSLTTNSSCLPCGRFAMPLISPLMPVPVEVSVCVYFSFVWFVYVPMCPPPCPTEYIFHTSMTRYSLFVLKVSLNTNKPTNQTVRIRCEQCCNFPVQNLNYGEFCFIFELSCDVFLTECRCIHGSHWLLAFELFSVAVVSTSVYF